MKRGVVKSGSPTPSEITSFIEAAMSKNLRIPEGGREQAIFEISGMVLFFHEMRAPLQAPHPLTRPSSPRPLLPPRGEGEQSISWRTVLPLPSEGRELEGEGPTGVDSLRSD